MEVISTDPVEAGKRASMRILRYPRWILSRTKRFLTILEDDQNLFNKKKEEILTCFFFWYIYCSNTLRHHFKYLRKILQLFVINDDYKQLLVTDVVIS